MTCEITKKLSIWPCDLFQAKGCVQLWEQSCGRHRRSPEAQTGISFSVREQPDLSAQRVPDTYSVRYRVLERAYRYLQCLFTDSQLLKLISGHDAAYNTLQVNVSYSFLEKVEIIMKEFWWKNLLYNRDSSTFPLKSFI